MTIEEYSKKMGYVTVATQSEFEMVMEIRSRVSGECSDDEFCAGLRAMFDNPVANEVWLMLDEIRRTCACLNATLGKKMRKNEELRKKNDELQERLRTICGSQEEEDKG